MKTWSGVFTALVTPFQNGKVDFESLDRLLDQQLKGGVDGFVVNGTTAESPVLKDSERKEIIDFVKKKSAGRVKIILGTGSNDTAKTVEETARAKSWGADAVLVVVPYYNKPPQRGLVQHFKTVAAATDLPVILYNVPGRTITALSLESIRELSKVKNVIGIKEASGNIEFAKQIREACGPDFVLLSGDDGTYYDFLNAGGEGVISVASHTLPAEFVRWTRAKADGTLGKYADEFKKLRPSMDALFVEANPIPVKKALQLMGLLKTAEMRLPLVEMDEALVPALKGELVRCGLLK